MVFIASHMEVDRVSRARRALSRAAATVAADGTYRLCGLPEKYEGKLQAQRRDGGATLVPDGLDAAFVGLEFDLPRFFGIHRPRKEQHEDRKTDGDDDKNEDRKIRSEHDCPVCCGGVPAAASAA